MPHHPDPHAGYPYTTAPPAPLPACPHGCRATRNCSACQQCPFPAAPAHYAERPTRRLQERREALLALPHDWTPDERQEVRAIAAELERRGVLSIGIAF